MPLNRVVALLTPLVFAPLAGFISLQLAKLGIDFKDGQVQTYVVQGFVFLVGVLIAFLKSRQWLKGWQGFEARHDWIANAALDKDVTAFLEEVASKTGVKLPAGVIDAVTVVEGPSQSKPPPAFEPGAMDDDAARA